MTIPFLAMSDAPITTTGLARITRELLKHIRTDPETAKVFRVGCLGVGQRSYLSKPYPQYPCSIQDYHVPQVMDAWKDFSHGRKGVLFTIWNPSWMAWMPQLEKKPFKAWGYFPVDAEGPETRLPHEQMEIINSFDRKLAYSAWCGKMIGADWLPHGIDTSIYKPIKLRKVGGLTIGICATNTRRKDWGLAAEVCHILKRRGHKLTIAIKTNTEVGDWHIPQMFKDFNIIDDAIIDTKNLLETEMANWYNFCDVTLAIGSGEGFGYPIAESLACGIPCLHGNYAGGAELGATLIDFVGYRWEGFTTDKRPVHDAKVWADAVEENIGKEVCLPPRLDWVNLWPEWKKWLLEGVE